MGVNLGVDEGLVRELREAILSIMFAKDMPLAVKKAMLGAAVVRTSRKLGRFYRLASAPVHKTSMFFNNKTKTLSGLKSDQFESWLAMVIGIDQSVDHYRAALNACLNEAMHGKDSIAVEPEAFWAARAGCVYVSNGPGQMVKVTADGVGLVDNGTDGVLFGEDVVLPPWKLVDETIDPFDAVSLWSDFHSADPHGRMVLRLWLHTLPLSLECKPPLCVTGPIRSGKTRALKGWFELLGIRPQIDDVGQEDKKSFWAKMDRGGLFVMDNADSDCSWLADSAATASTGNGATDRLLYTNKSLSVCRPRAALAITSADPKFAADPGLGDRMQIVRMEPTDGPTKDAEFKREIAAVRDGALSHWVTVIKRVLADTGEVPKGINARHPDYAEAAIKIGRALGLEQEAIAALQAAEHDKAVLCVETDTVIPSLLQLVRRRPIGVQSMPARELLELLNREGGDVPEGLTPKGFGKRLNNKWSQLKTVMKVAKREMDRDGVHLYTFQN